MSMVKGIERREKRYVEVVAHFDADGACMPLVIVIDGRRFNIDSTTEVRRAASMKVGGYGIRYSVQIGGKLKHLWRDDKGWYVEYIVASDSACRS